MDKNIYDIKKYLQQQIESQKNTYLKDPDRMVSDYNREIELANEYDGRQIFELLQNADDEEAEKVQIELNEDQKILSIVNSGESFSKKGYKSLMLSNLSSKTKQRYIGNKGLGFRAIISWADNISINSNGLDVEFSHSIAKSEFNNLFKKQEQEDIRQTRDLSQDAIPFAMLAVPRISEKKLENWSTAISITYKPDRFEDIKFQINSLEKEILLFLNSLNEIRIKTSEKEFTISRQISRDEIIIEDTTWKIYSSAGVLPDNLQNKNRNESENFSLKIAVSDNLSTSYKKLFSFFPTKVDINFPVIIHGTFDLDSSRNQINKSNKNKYILDRLIELIISTAKEISGKEVSWKPLQILNYSSKNYILDELEFYDKIDAAIDELPIIPCIDNTYRKLIDVVHFDQELTELVVNTSNQHLFPEFVKLTAEIDSYL